MADSDALKEYRRLSPKTEPNSLGRYLNDEYGKLEIVTDAQSAVTVLLESRILESEGDIAALDAELNTVQGAIADLAVEIVGIDSIGRGRGYFAGFGLSHSLLDANNDINITTGVCRDSADTGDIVLGSALTKRLDASWAVGDGNGGLLTGSKAADTSYYLHVIERVDTGVVDVGFDPSPTSPTLPANYSPFRCIGFVRTDGSGNIRQGRWAGGDFYYTTPVRDVNTTITTSEAKHTLVSVPAIEGVYALATFTTFHGSTAQGARIMPGFQTADSSSGIVCFGNSSAGGTIPYDMMVDSQGRISVIGSTTAITFVVDIRGYRFIP